MIVCAHNTQEEAFLLAEKLRLAIVSYTFTKIGTKTASFGVASVQKNEIEMEFIQRVDSALYKAKELGRNKVVQG